MNNTINNKEIDYEINEEYFSFIRNKIEEANDEILDYRRFSRRSFDIEKLKFNNKNSKMKTEDVKVCEEIKMSSITLLLKKIEFENFEKKLFLKFLI